MCECYQVTHVIDMSIGAGYEVVLQNRGNVMCYGIDV